MRRSSLVAVVGLCCAVQAPAGDVRAAEVPPVVPPAWTDQAETLSPAAVHLDGWLGARVAANAAVRLKTVDTEPLLAGYRQKPGSHPWIGEHVGKWMHAATLAWVNTGDPDLRAKLDRVAADLIAAQEPDGYLGTYVPEKRLGLYQGSNWDVWSHKYNLIGLLTYYQYTGNAAALQASRKAADLLLRTFPSQKSILAAGTHVGMAATSVLEPIVLLHRFTGDPRYLEFAKYIVASWDEPNGPKIVASLLAGAGVNKTANAKAYEMMSNLVGLCELARTTGDKQWLVPVLKAWDDVVARRLYLTGTASSFEHFQDDYALPNQPSAHVGETCVTVTWIQLCLQLLRLTGEARYGDELERAFYNHLAAAQQPQGDDWCYYTALEGKKPYDKGITCCHSSGPRGMALAPQSAYLRQHTAEGDTVLVSTFETSQATLDLGGQSVRVELQSAFPRQGTATITFRLKQPAKFGVKFRVPAWAAPVVLNVGGKSYEAQQGWATIPVQSWHDGQQVQIRFNLAAKAIVGDHGNAGLMAMAWGPLVLAYDQARNAEGPTPQTAGYASNAPAALQPAGNGPLAWATHVVARRSKEPLAAVLSTFADAGADGSRYRVWLRAPGVESAGTDSLLIDGDESRSRPGNQKGSIIDGDPNSIVVTFDGKLATEDWFAVTLPAAVKVGRVVFAHGRNFHDGGWFNTREGKPRVQVKATADAAWETVGVLAAYPETTATEPGRLKSGQVFMLKLAAPVAAVALRVVGTPAGGDNPRQAFSSCGELEAFAQ